MAVTLSSLFNEAYYLSQNPDVAEAVKAGVLSSGLAHWEQYGVHEGRAFSEAFNPAVYAANNPDLAEAGLTTPAQLTLHYVQFGIFEGRSIFTAAQFNAAIYAASNPDLAANGVTDPVALYQHFTTYGVTENRVASAFDGAAYLAANKDLADYLAAGNTFGGYTGVEAARFHYYNNGIYEGRAFPTGTQGYSISSPAAATEGSEVSFTVTLKLPATTDTTISYLISADDMGGLVSKVDQNDFSAMTGTVTIKAGETTGTITLTPKADGVSEGVEGFKVSLLGDTGAVLATGTPVRLNDGVAAAAAITVSGAATANADKVTVNMTDVGGGVTGANVTADGGAGFDTLRLTGNTDLRIDLTNSANQVRGIDLNGNGKIDANGVENNVSASKIFTAKNFEVVDAYSRNPLNQTDTTKNFLGDIAYDGTGYAGDGVTTNGSIVLGGLGADTIFGGIGNDFLVGGGVAQARGGGSDQLYGGRNADLFFAEMSKLDSTDGNGTLSIDGGNTYDDKASQDSDWLLLEASDDDEATTVNLQVGGNTDNGNVTTRSGVQLAALKDVENLDASGNLYQAIDQIDTKIGGRATDSRVDGFTRDADADKNFGIGTTAQLIVNGSAENNIIVAGYDNDSVDGGAGNDVLFGGNLGYLLRQQNNANLLNATGGLNLNVNATTNVVNDGRDTLLGGAGDDSIVFEMDGGSIDGGAGTDSLFLTNFTAGRLAGATWAGEKDNAGETAALTAQTTDNTVRIDLGVGTSATTAEFRGYGGSNKAGTADQTNYKTGASSSVILNTENVIATGLGSLDYDVDGSNKNDINVKSQQNFAGINANLALRGTDVSNVLYANTGNDVIEGRGGADSLSGGRGNDTFVFQAGDGVDVVHRQLDANNDGIWDTDASGAGLFTQDFAVKGTTIPGSPTTINFTFTDLTRVDDVGAVSFQLAGVGTINVNVAAATDLAGIVSILSGALPAGVTVTAVDATTIRFTDSVGRVATAPGVTSVSGTALPVTLGPITQGTAAVTTDEQDRLVFQTYADRATNTGVNTTNTALTLEGEKLAVGFTTDAAGNVSTGLVNGQVYEARFTDLNVDDTVTVTVNGQSFTVKLAGGSETARLQEIRDAINNGDAGGSAGKLTASLDTATVDGNVVNTLLISGDEDVFMMAPTFTLVNGSGGSAPTATLLVNGATVSNAASSSNQITLLNYDARNGGFTADNVLFVGEPATVNTFTSADSKSVLLTASNAGSTLTGKDAQANGLHGDDLLIGGNGNDSLSGGTGDDDFYGSKGTDTIVGGGDLTGTTFEDTLLFKRDLFTATTAFTVAVDAGDDLLGKGKGTVTSVDGTTTVGTTQFSGIEQVRTIGNASQTVTDTLDVSALSNRINVVTTASPNTAMLASEGVTVNLTSTGNAVTRTVDLNNDGDVADANESNYAVLNVTGVENVIGGNANDTVNLDASQYASFNTINLGSQGTNGADTVSYDHSALAAAGRPAMTISVEAAADTDTVALAGGGTDRLVSVEQLNISNAATGTADDTLDVSAIAGATVNYGGAVTVLATLGGGTLNAGGIAVTGNGVGTERLTVTGLTEVEKVNGSTGSDRVILDNAMSNTRASATATAIGLASAYGAATTTSVNVNLFKFDLGAGDDILDYRAETGRVNVVVNSGTGADLVIVDGNSDNNLNNSTQDRVDQATNVERYFGGTGVNTIDLSAVTLNTTINFSAEASNNNPTNEFADPNGTASGATNVLRGTSVASTADASQVFARFMNVVGGASFTVVAGSANAETVIVTDAETAAAHTFNLGAGANKVDAGAVTTATNFTVGALTLGTATHTFNGDTVSSSANSLTLVASSGNTSDTIDVSALTNGAKNVVNLESGLVQEYGTGASPSVVNAVNVSNFENVTGSSIADFITGSSSANGLNGGAGNDSISGGGGADTLTGGEGKDIIVGGAGADSIVLTEGASVVDRIIYSASAATESSGFNQATTGTADIVTGFTTTVDKIVISVADTSNVLNAALGLTNGNNDTDGDANDATIVVDLGSDNAVGGVGAAADVSIDLEDIGTVVAGDVVFRVLQTSGADAQTLSNAGGSVGSYELVYTARDQSTLGTRDEITNFDGNTDVIDLSSFGFTGTGTAAIKYSNPVSVDNASTLTDLFDDGGVDRRVAVQLEQGTTNLRVFIDVNGDGDFNQADDMVIDLVGVTNGGGTAASWLDNFRFNDFSF
ncbi:hypothetical protein GE253_04175 [Niveispirillum sp. SYP-B3756]|uniref:beta strand repeat-containing protein n=1 Tax=Niveispirillum sp. SYP-B3756 TaxID=2662178 RepID=UPI00129101F6|nr:hypothetical protein [Niveispirillum sp. SYP-B3756]MQP64537.1 hypothetical protein [Niveispirillum sp. SYP-B3756]